MNQQYLFLFTIGPVQSFIAQARKTQDLYAGSRILSELTKTGIDLFDFDKDIIFPKAKGESLPNRFIAKFAGTPQEAKNKGEAAEKAARSAWRKIADKALKNSKADISIDWEHYENNETILQKAFYQQIEQHLDIHWAFEPIKNDDYATAYNNLEALVGSIKNLRTFQQFTYNGIGEKGRKCSLDGERNALFYRKTDKAKVPSFIYNGSEISKNQLNPGEGLSAVSFVKRFYKTVEKFPSTAGIALMNSLSKVDISEFRRVFGKDNLLHQVEKEGCLKIDGKDWVEWDEQFYYEENLNDQYIPCKDQLEIAKREHKNLKANFKEAGVPFTKYYALIIFDGDSMGKWLSGSKLKAGSNLEAFHSNFSNLLAEYADKAKGIVTEPKGKTIYAGGDDFLGLVNVHELFDVMKELRVIFETSINQNSELQKLKKDGENFTFSAGIVIAHYKMPLAEVLKQARRTEKKAKNEGGKNAFAITAMKHSGEVQETVLKWGKNSITDIWQALEYITNKLKDDTFSSKFISNLTTELYQLAGQNLASLSQEFDKVVYAESERLIKNAFIEFEGKRDKAAKKEQVDLLAEKLKVIYESRNPKREKEFAATQNFIHALQIADFLTRKTTQDQ